MNSIMAEYNKNKSDIENMKKSFMSFLILCLENKLDCNNMWVEDSFLDRESHGLSLYKYLKQRGIECTYYYDDLEDDGKELFLQVSVGDVEYEELLGAFRGVLLSYDDDVAPPEVPVGITAKYHLKNNTFSDEHIIPASVIYQVGNDQLNFIIKSVDKKNKVLYLGSMDGDITRPDLFSNKYLTDMSGEYAVGALMARSNEEKTKLFEEVWESDEEFTLYLDFLNSKDYNEKLVEPYIKK